MNETRPELKTTRALLDRLQADSKLRRLCGFDLRHALPSEATFSRAFAEFSTSELIQRVHVRMIEDTLGDQQVCGHAKVMCHLMLAVVALSADQLMRLLV